MRIKRPAFSKYQAFQKYNRKRRLRGYPSLKMREWERLLALEFVATYARNPRI